MNNKKIYLLALLLFVCILSISTISATENTTNKDVISANNNQGNNLETNIQQDDVSTSKENSEFNVEENNDERKRKSRIDKTTTNEDPLTFTDLNTTINNNTNSTIYLSNNYQYNEGIDDNFINGIPINRDLTVYGNGVTLDGSKIGRIFKLSDLNLNVKFYNINFINGNTNNITKDGGAIYGGNAYNCTFKDNNAASFGGAIFTGNAYNCTFKDNNAASFGGAIYGGNAYNCTFKDNNAASFGGAIFIGNAYNCTFEGNKANDGGAISNGTAYDCTFTNNNAQNSGGGIKFADAYNCTFEGNKANDGGAIGYSNAYNSTFTNNNAQNTGGGIEHGNAYNSTFTNNNACYGGAIFQGNAYNCTFTNNNAQDYGGGISKGEAYNCTFIGNNATNYGGAIDNGCATNCIFTGNYAGYGGALNWCNAYNCTFANNTAMWEGGAMYYRKAILCIFNGDTYQTSIIRTTINVLNYTTTYKSGERLKFNLTADNMLFDGFNTTIKIYKGEELFTTVYGLSGEGWIVDLDPGEYTAVLSLTDYPDEQPSNATITVLKENTIVNITPITDIVVGKEITITYTTNSNGTATIKVNGQPITEGKFTPTKEGTYNVIVGEEVTINYTTNSNGTVTIKVNGQNITDNKFTPTKEGTYNVTIEIAENDYYTPATNSTTFTAEKIVSKITAKTVTTTYNVAKDLIINLKDSNGNAIKRALLTVNLGRSKKYTTDDNGQIKINVGTLTPKTYNAKITYAGSDIYKGSTSSVKVTVKKAKAKITAKSARFKLKVKTKKYTAYFKDNKNKALKNTKVSLKVYGKTYTTKTNSKGQGIFKITNLRKIGSYIAVITIPANHYYNKVSKKVKITVKP